jgi:hypothetical protein
VLIGSEWMDFFYLYVNFTLLIGVIEGIEDHSRISHFSLNRLSFFILAEFHAN